MRTFKLSKILSWYYIFAFVLILVLGVYLYSTFRIREGINASDLNRIQKIPQTSPNQITKQPGMQPSNAIPSPKFKVGDKVSIPSPWGENGFLRGTVNSVKTDGSIVVYYDKVLKIYGKIYTEDTYDKDIIDILKLNPMTQTSPNVINKQPGMQPGMQSRTQPGMKSGIQPGMQPRTQPGMKSGIQPGLQSSSVTFLNNTTDRELILKDYPNLKDCSELIIKNNKLKGKCKDNSGQDNDITDRTVYPIFYITECPNKDIRNCNSHPTCGACPEIPKASRNNLNPPIVRVM